MLSRLRRLRNILAREAGILGRFLALSQDEVKVAMNTRPPLARSWEESQNELKALFA